MRRRSPAAGGSSVTDASVSIPEPTLNVASQVEPSSTVPIAISVDPPPTSITTMVPSAGAPRRLGGAPERELRLLAAREDAHRKLAALRDQVDQLVAVGCRADRCGGDNRDVV